jgi:diacylglycerol O-acyltransferase
MARTAVDVGKMMLKPAPATPFNRPITAARQIAWLELPLEEVHRVRKALGATVNDLVLTILAGGLARYMRRSGMNTNGVELRCLCPVSVRSADQNGTFGNQVSMVAAPLYVGLNDPRARLDAQMSAMRELKDSDQARGFHELFSTWEYMAPVVFQRIWASWPMSYFPFNIVSTNVPGPREPLYLGRHELLHWYPVGVNWSTAGLFLCTLTYREYMTMGLVADPSIVTDLWRVSEDFRAAYEEIKAAVGKPRAAAGAVHEMEQKKSIPAKRARSTASAIEAKMPKPPAKAAKRAPAGRRPTRSNARTTRPAS